MAVRGIIGAFSRGVRQDLISDKDLMAWYDEIHIPDVVATSGMKTAFRFEALDPKAKYPWLVIYPVNDIGFAGTEEFDKIPKGGHKEIGGRQFTDLAELDLRIGVRTQVVDGPNAKKGRSSYILAESIHVTDENAAGFDEWYNNEFLKELASIPSFRRATRYNVVQSLIPGWPKHLAFHEFNTVDIPFADIQKARETSSARTALKDANVDSVGYKLVKEAGVLDESL